MQLIGLSLIPHAGHSKWITAIAWEPAHAALPARRFVSGSKDTTVKVYIPSRGTLHSFIPTFCVLHITYYVESKCSQLSPPLILCIDVWS